MKRGKYFAFLMGLVLGLAACGSGGQGVGPIPSVMVFQTPWETPLASVSPSVYGYRGMTVTSLPTRRPTATWAPSRTPSPTATLRPLATLTPLMPLAEIGSPTWTGIGDPLLQPNSRIIGGNATQLEKLARWGKGVISDIVYSGDGRWFAVGSSAGAYVYYAQDLSKDPHYIFTGSPVFEIALSSDGRALAVVLENDTIQLWRLGMNGAWEIAGAVPGIARWVDFSPDDQFLAVNIAIGRISSYRYKWGVQLWRVSDGAPFMMFPGGKFVFSPDGRHLAISAGDDYSSIHVNIHRLPDGEIVNTIYGEDSIRSIAFAPDSATLAIGIEHGEVEFHRVVDGELTGLLEALDPYYVIIRSPCGRGGGCGGDYGEDTADWYRPEPVEIEFSPTGQFVFVRYISKDGSRKIFSYLYRASNGALLRAFSEEIEGTVISPKDGTLATIMWNQGLVQFWGLDDGVLLGTIYGFNTYVHALVFSPAGNAMAVRYLDSIRVRALRDGGQWQRFAEPSIAYSADGERVAIGKTDGTIEVRDLSNMSLIQTLEGHKKGIVSLAFSPSGDLLISASQDCTTRIWDLEEGVFLRNPEDYVVEEYYSAGIRKVIMSPDGRTFAGVVWDGYGVGLWRLSDGALLHKFDAGGAIAFSPDGRFIALGAEVRDVETGAVVVRMDLPDDDYVSSVAFSPDGTLLAGGSSDGLVYIWRVSDGEMLHVLEANEAGKSNYSSWVRGVMSVTFSPDGRFIAAGGYDGTVHVWGALP